MPLPQTLLALAGAKPQPAGLSEAAVIIIDAQREYLDGALGLPGIDARLAQIESLLARARKAGTPVFHVRHLGRAGGLFDPEGDGSQILAAAGPAEGETVVEKRLPNAFAGTDLDERLRGLGVKKLIFAGFMTHMCISSSVRAAFDLGYDCTVVASASGTRALPRADSSGVLSADEMHAAALAGLADRFATIAGDVGAIPN